MTRAPLPTVAARAGALLCEAREEAGMSQTELGLKLGWGGASRISKMERGQGATLENLAACAAVLGVPLRELVPE